MTTCAIVNMHAAINECIISVRESWLHHNPLVRRHRFHQPAPTLSPSTPRAHSSSLVLVRRFYYSYYDYDMAESLINFPVWNLVTINFQLCGPLNSRSPTPTNVTTCESSKSARKFYEISSRPFTETLINQ